MKYRQFEFQPGLGDQRRGGVEPPPCLYGGRGGSWRLNHGSTAVVLTIRTRSRLYGGRKGVVEARPRLDGGRCYACLTINRRCFCLTLPLSPKPGVPFCPRAETLFRHALRRGTLFPTEGVSSGGAHPHPPADTPPTQNRVLPVSAFRNRVSERGKTEKLTPQAFFAAWRERRAVRRWRMSNPPQSPQNRRRR